MITIGICTLNRASLIGECVRLLAEQKCSEEFEILVADNGSDDGTQDVLAELRAEFTSVRSIVVPIRGQTHARNALIDSARGDVLLFTDDDLRPAPGWVEALTAPFRVDADLAATGGRVTLQFDGERPRWLTKRWADYLAERDYGDTYRLMEGFESPVGASMAIRTGLLRMLGGFDVRLGHAGNLPIGGEEYEFFRRLKAQGHVMSYVPEPSTTHLIPRDRQTLRYMTLRLFCYGVSQGRVDRYQRESDSADREVLLLLGRSIFRGKRAAVMAARRDRSIQPILEEYFNIARTIGYVLGRRGWRAE